MVKRAEVDRRLHVRLQIGSGEGVASDFATPAPEREDAFRVGIIAHFEAIEVLRLPAEPGIVDLHVKIALARKNEINTSVEAGARRVVAACELLAVAV